MHVGETRVVTVTPIEGVPTPSSFSVSFINDIFSWDDATKTIKAVKTRKQDLLHSNICVRFIRAVE